MRNFNEIFSKDLTYDNIESHKKAGLLFWKECRGGEGQAGPLQALLGLNWKLQGQF